MVDGVGDAVPAGEAGQADSEVAEGCHRPGCVAGAHAGGVLGEGDVTDVVEGLDGSPVPAGEFGQPGRVGLFGDQVGDCIYRFGAGLAGLEVGPSLRILDT
ncbi:hypothetical protein AOB60_01420 [Streptomyces noursei]|uniref:Uncharacterized protein n=1 Tax=Streptomyces noursei TaxID=1971 RepID=A0A2N8PFP5_STRNR|nr:hypothetical protein AOB60_01420 [Streptomyces noursei]